MFAGSKYECYKRRLILDPCSKPSRISVEMHFFRFFYFLNCYFRCFLSISFLVCLPALHPNRTIYDKSWKLAVFFLLEILFRFLFLLARFAIETFSFVVPKQIPFRLFMFGAYLARIHSIYVHIYRSTRKIATIGGAV